MSVSRHNPNPLSRRRLSPRERIDWHDHGDNQVIYPSAGVLSVSTAAGSWVVPAHRAVWLPAGVPHSHQAHGPTQVRSLLFPPDVNPLDAAEPVVMAVTPLLREVLIALTDDASRPDESRPDESRPDESRPDESRPASEREHLRLVALDQFRRLPGPPLHLPEPADDRLRAIAGLLHADPSDRRTLAGFGAATGASERTLSRLFRQETGMTFPVWRAQLRLHHAVVALTGGRPVTAVGAACGFGSTSAFIEAFRRAFGVTPGAYQAELRRVGSAPRGGSRAS